ncbi:MAG: histidine kinase dimerization/phospho-acceptor domain-containing protein, partial [Myxococcota bacterium]
MAKTASPSIVRALPLLAALTAVVLLLSQLFAWLGIDRAAAAANRAEASLLLDALRAHLHGEGRPPELVDLEPFLSTHRESGLRYAAVRGRLGVSEAGDRQIANEPSDELVADGERLLATDRLGPPPPGFPPPFGLEKGPPRFGHPPHKGKAPRKGTRLGGPRLIVELEPRLGPELRSNAFSALLASSIAAVLFFVLAFTLRRSLRQRELLQAQAEQDRRLATLGEMSSVLAHEIRNPLASLKGHAQLLVETLDGDERRQNKAKRIVGEAVRLEKLTNDLLRFVRSGSLHIAHVSFQELVNEAIESLDEPDR